MTKVKTVWLIEVFEDEDGPPVETKVALTKKRAEAHVVKLAQEYLEVELDNWTIGSLPECRTLPTGDRVIINEEGDVRWTVSIFETEVV